MNPEVMIVEDETVISMQLEERLKSMGYRVVGNATNGEESVDLARSLHPELVLMDIVMPGRIDGIEAAEIISRDFDIPVVFMTAWSDEDYVRRATRSKPFGYVVKPFQMNEIRAAIEVAINRKNIERRLVDSDEKFRAILNSLEDAVLVLGDGNSVGYKNTAARTLFAAGGVVRNEGSLFDFIHPDDHETVSDAMKLFSENGFSKDGVVLTDVTFVLPDSGTFSAEMTMVPIQVRSGGFTICVVRSSRESVRKISSDDMLMLPVCSYCQKVRTDNGAWEAMNAYLRKNHDLQFSHTICPTCLKINYPSLDDDNS